MLCEGTASSRLGIPAMESKRKRVNQVDCAHDWDIPKGTPKGYECCSTCGVVKSIWEAYLQRVVRYEIDLGYPLEYLLLDENGIDIDGYLQDLCDGKVLPTAEELEWPTSGAGLGIRDVQLSTTNYELAIQATDAIWSYLQRVTGKTEMSESLYVGMTAYHILVCHTCGTIEESPLVDPFACMDCCEEERYD